MKIDLQEELGLISLEREIMEIEGKLFDLFAAMEVEERPRFRKPLEAEYSALVKEHATLTRRWLASGRERT